MLDVKDFIKETLIQISLGVEEAKTEIDKSAPNCKLNPTTSAPYGVNIREVKFDIAVTVVEEKAASGGGKIKVLGIGAKGDVSSSAQNSVTSRISFDIPMGFKYEKPAKEKTIHAPITAESGGWG